MEKLTLDLTVDTGIQVFQINGLEVLRFNPGDPNVYARLLGAMDEIKAVERDLVEKSKGIQEDDGTAALYLMAEADKRIKNILGQVFGPENDFDKILGGVSLLAVAGNGERVVTNLLNALFPIIHDGAERCARQQVDQAVAEAEAERALRQQ